MSRLDKLRYKYAMLDTSGKLIVWIVVSTLVAWLFQFSIPRISRQLDYVLPDVYASLALPGYFNKSVWQPWSFITYGFLHSGIFHVLFNMMALHFVGRNILNIVGSKPFLGLFFMGVLAGGLGFSIATFIAPAYLNSGLLVGASAGVYALLFFLCFYMPDTQVRLIFWNVRLIYIAYALLVIDVFSIIARLNAGGSVAHLAGAGIGYLAAIKFKEGTDITRWTSVIFDFFEKLFSKKQQKAARGPLKTVYKNKTPRYSNPVLNKTDKQQQVDAILEKISASGYESLTKVEKDFLFQAGKE